MEIRRLKNGLTVAYEPEGAPHSVPIDFSVNVGSGDDPTKIQGLSHFLEHMIFKRTPLRKSIELVEGIEGKGGELNASTDHEYTSFQAKTLKKHFGTTLELLSDFFLHPIFRRGDINTERGAVHVEIDKVEDNTHEYIGDMAINLLYPGWRPIIYGTRRSIGRITRQDLEQHHRQYYVAGNSIVSILGEVENPFGTVEKFFSKMPPGKRLRRSLDDFDLSTPPQKRIWERKEIKGNYLCLGFRIMPKHHYHSPTMELIDTMLSDGMGSILFQEIREKIGKTYGIATLREFWSTNGAFVLNCCTRKGNVRLVKNIILKEIKRLERITSGELKKAKEKYEGIYLLGDENTWQRVNDISRLWVTTRHPELFKNQLENVVGVTKEDIAYVISNYFSSAPYSQVVAHRPA